MEFRLLDGPDDPPTWRRYVFPTCIGTTLFLVLMQVVIMLVVASRAATTLADLAPITTEVRTTMQDVNVVMPEMRETLKILGRMLPEIESGMDILHQLCGSDPHCSPGLYFE